MHLTTKVHLNRSQCIYIFKEYLFTKIIQILAYFISFNSNDLF